MVGASTIAFRSAGVEGHYATRPNVISRRLDTSGPRGWREAENCRIRTV